MQQHFDRRPDTKIRILPYGPLHAAMGLIARDTKQLAGIA